MLSFVSVMVLLLYHSTFSVHSREFLSPGACQRVFVLPRETTPKLSNETLVVGLNCVLTLQQDVAEDANPLWRAL